MPNLAQLATNVQRATWRLEVAKLTEATRCAQVAARKGDEESLRAALGIAQAAVEHAFAALPERAT